MNRQPTTDDGRPQPSLKTDSRTPVVGRRKIRNYKKLRIFKYADDLVMDMYRVTKQFPDDERYGLISQLRRAAASVPTNIVEGCTRPTKKDYQRFLSIAMGSASEARYLFGLAYRLGYVSDEEYEATEERFDRLVRSMQRLIMAVAGKEKPTTGVSQSRS